MLWRSILIGVLRNLISASSGALVTNGTLTADDAQTIIGGIGAIVPIIWSAVDKIKDAKNR